MNPPALIGEGVAWFASKRWRHHNICSPGSDRCCVIARANRARKQSQTGVFGYFWRPKSNKEKILTREYSLLSEVSAQKG